MDLSAEISSIKNQIRNGKLDARILSSALTDGNAELARSINELLDLYHQETVKKNIECEKTASGYNKSIATVGELIDLFVREFSLMADGDLSRSVSFQKQSSLDDASNKILQGLFDLYAVTKSSLIGFKQDISAISKQMDDGNLNTIISLSSQKGIYKKFVDEFVASVDSIKKPFHEAKRVCTQFASYDFSARFSDSIIAKGEWKELKESLNTVGIQVNEAFRSINQQVMELSANVEQANASVQEVANSSAQVARNSNAVSENTEQSDAGVRQVLRAMEDLSVTVGDVSQKAESVSRLAHDGTQMAREGSEFAKKAEQGMGLIITSAEEADQLIGDIQGEMKKINEIVRLITDIANQTNLLALNAAIEAARAGEMGRGFAVVAAEVKALALESRQSAEKITDMIGNLQKQSQKAANAVSGATVAVRDGNVLLSDTLSVFGKLAGSVEEISMNIEQVASMNEEQAAAVEEITSSMHEVSAMLKDTAKEAVDSATATNEASASSQQLKVIVDQVAGIAEQISVSMARFTL